MNIKNGKIRNINKKIFTGALIFSIVSSSIVGCSVSNNIKLERQKYENFTSIASFEKLKDCYFISLKDNDGNIKCYIVEKIPIQESNSYVYLDLLSNKNVFITKNSNNFTVDSNQKLINEVKVEEYLYDFKMIEKNYSEDDIKKLLNQIKQFNDKDNEKVK